MASQRRFRIKYQARNGSWKMLPDASFEDRERAQAYLEKYHSKVTHKVVDVILPNAAGAAQHRDDASQSAEALNKRIEALEVPYDKLAREHKMAYEAMRRSKSNKNITAFHELDEALDKAGAELRDLRDQHQKQARREAREGRVARKVANRSGMQGDLFGDADVSQLDSAKLDAACAKADLLSRRMDGVERTLARERVDARAYGDAAPAHVAAVKKLNQAIRRLVEYETTYKSKHPISTQSGMEADQRWKQLKGEVDRLREAAYAEQEKGRPRNDAEPRTFGEHQKALQKAFKEVDRLMDEVFAASPLKDARFSEALASVSPALRERFSAASRRRSDLESSAVSAGHAYYSGSLLMSSDRKRPGIFVSH